jgi:predicted DNA-binding transcriptional regulator AlpA
METHSFTLVIDGGAGTDERIDALFDAGCGDATFSHSPAISYGDFDRDGESLLDAVLSAIEAVESVPGLRVRRLDSDDLLTVPALADRLGRTRQSVYQLIDGTRGAGHFPAPVSSARGRGKVWAWTEVAEWAGVDYDHTRAVTIAAVNGALSLRRARASLDGAPIARLLDFAAA